MPKFYWRETSVATIIGNFAPNIAFSTTEKCISWYIIFMNEELNYNYYFLKVFFLFICSCSIFLSILVLIDFNFWCFWGGPIQIVNVSKCDTHSYQSFHYPLLYPFNYWKVVFKTHTFQMKRNNIVVWFYYVKHRDVGTSRPTWVQIACVSVIVNTNHMSDVISSVLKRRPGVSRKHMW